LEYIGECAFSAFKESESVELPSCLFYIVKMLLLNVRTWLLLWSRIWLIVA